MLPVASPLSSDEFEEFAEFEMKAEELMHSHGQGWYCVLPPLVWYNLCPFYPSSSSSSFIPCYGMAVQLYHSSPVQALYQAPADLSQCCAMPCHGSSLQVCLPGGKRDPEDPDDITCALVSAPEQPLSRMLTPGRVKAKEAAQGSSC